MGWLCDNGHVAAARDFARQGISRRALATAVARHELIRLRPGTYACPHIDDDLRTAATAGLQLDCVSLLGRTPDQWSGRSAGGLHLFARGGQHPGHTPPHATIHWSRRPHLGVTGALIRAAGCLPPIDWLACVESALHLGALDDSQLSIIRDEVSTAYRAMLTRLDRGAQSGFETHTRCLLVHAGHQVETQVRVPGAGTLDLLVDGLVGVETDGRRWHDERFLADRSKDIHTEAWGIRVLRIAAPHIFESWPTTLATIERMLDDARRARRAGMHTPGATRR